jgi:ribosomal protein L7/L12
MLAPMDPDVRHAFDNITQRIRVIEANIRVLAENAGLQMEEPAGAQMPEQIPALVMAGKKIEAIKAYRDWMPTASLQEAKDAIDAI